MILVLAGAWSTHAALTRTLRLGDRGADVRELQQILNTDTETRISESGIGAPGYESEYFGIKTQMAVRKFQQKYATEILTPAGLMYPTGIVAARTIAKLLTLGQSVVTPAPVVTSSLPVAPVIPVQQPIEKPSISSISPSVVTSLRQTLTIAGSGFTPYGNTVTHSTSGEYGIGGLSSADGKTITLDYTHPMAQSLAAELLKYKNTGQYSDTLKAITGNIGSGGTVTVQGGKPIARVVLNVKNQNGESNTASFTVDMSAVLKSI